MAEASRAASGRQSWPGGAKGGGVARLPTGKAKSENIVTDDMVNNIVK